MKKIGFLTVLIMAMALFALAFTATAAGPAAPAPAAAAAPAPVPVPPAASPMPPPHHHIHEALESMRAARAELATAVPEFQGHREEALKHLDRAIHEAEICEQMP